MVIPRIANAIAPAVVPLVDPNNRISAAMMQQRIPGINRFFLIVFGTFRSSDAETFSRGPGGGVGSAPCWAPVGRNDVLVGSSLTAVSIVIRKNRQIHQPDHQVTI
jgi:hypothetical protein